MERIEEILKKMLADPSPSVREAASASLDRLRAKRSAPACIESLRTGSVEERMRTVFSAEDIGGKEGVSILLAALSNDEGEVRAAAARALSFSPTVPVLKALVERLPREKGIVLGNLLETLGKSRRKELSPVIEKFLANSDPEVAGKAAMAYALTAGKEGLEKLLLQASAGNDSVRTCVARALAEWSAEG